MSSPFKAHRVLAVIVLVGAAAWVATGEFAAVGSEEVKAAETETAAPVAETATDAVTDPAAAPTAEGTAEVAPLRTVAAVTPVFADYAREIRVSGATEADKSAVLAARANGIVQELGVAQGADVTADALVLRLEGADVEASVTTAQASLAQASQQLQVGEELFTRGSLPELELTSRRAAKSAADAALSQAQAAADRLMLKAPFAGSVDSVNVELGEWVQAGTPIATILSLDPIVVKAEVSERDVVFVAVGSQAKVRLVDGTEMQGTIRHLAKQASEKTRTFAIEVALPNADRMIPSGMTAEVRLFAAPVPAVVVPRSIITMSEDGVIGLRMVTADNKAKFAPITIIDDSEQGLVVTGVPKDMRVIVAGQDLVNNDEEVVVSEMTPAEAAEALK